MPKNPIGVKGIRKLLDVIADDVMDVTERAAKMKDGERADFEAVGELKLAGRYGFDRKGNLGFVGNIVASAGQEAIAEAAGDFQTGIDADWNNTGDGTLEITFRVVVKVPGDRKPSVEIPGSTKPSS